MNPDIRPNTEYKKAGYPIQPYIIHNNNNNTLHSVIISGPNGRFLRADEEDNIVFDQDKVSDTEIIQLRNFNVQHRIKLLNETYIFLFKD